MVGNIASGPWRTLGIASRPESDEASVSASREASKHPFTSVSTTCEPAAFNTGGPGCNS